MNQESLLTITAAAPVAVTAIGTMLVLLADLFCKLSRTSHLILMQGVCMCGLVFSVPMYWWSDTALYGLVYCDPFAMIFNFFILGGLSLILLLSYNTLSGQRVKSSLDFDVLMMLAAIGGMVMVSAANLMVMFLGFELLSVAVYALTGLARGERASAEGALKYFILGAFSSAFLLYGIVLVFGATGSMELAGIAAAATTNSSLLYIGFGLMLFGFGFKISLVPFHFWTPDAYQGAPVTVTTFMAAVVKAAAFGGFLRIMMVAFGDVAPMWEGLIWTLAVVTMTLGNILALQQKSIKRMLAYSSVAHAGYALIGVLVLNVEGGAAATIFYLLVYSVMTIGSFGVVLLVTSGSEQQYDKDSVQAFRGLGWERPFLGICMTIFLLSLAGMPPLAGFVGKFFIFKAAVSGGFVGLAIVAAINSVVSLYYYLYVIVVMYFGKENERASFATMTKGFVPNAAVGVAAVLIVALGISSSYSYNIASLAAGAL